MQGKTWERERWVEINKEIALFVHPISSFSMDGGGGGRKHHNGRNITEYSAWSWKANFPRGSPSYSCNTVLTLHIESKNWSPGPSRHSISRRIHPAMQPSTQQPLLMIRRMKLSPHHQNLLWPCFINSEHTKREGAYWTWTWSHKCPSRSLSHSSWMHICA